jgi:hypothetical protein
MAEREKADILSHPTMNTCAYTTSLRPHPVPDRPAGHWPLAALERLINTAGLVSVDLTDTVFTPMPEPEDQAHWAEVGPFALP